MCIYKSKKDVLDSFICERITSDDSNRELIQSFHSNKGKGLVSYLCERGWEQDQIGENAFYLVKSGKGIPFLFFGIKCGGVFQPLTLEKRSKMNKKYLNYCISVRNNYNNDNKEIEISLDTNPERTISISDIIDKKKAINENNQRFLKLVREDEKNEGMRPIQRVDLSFSGVEITHFCVNDDVRPLWESLREQYDFEYTMGEIFFWKFIVPKFVEIQKIVGCQYAYLFAADLTAKRRLSNYYKNRLHFRRDEKLGVLKPLYDMNCEFLSQSVDDMKNNMDNFWGNFN